MKTTDLIPILLYHLKDGDKYGLELVDACKECSNGRIEIKQPTLYSVLKKLEKSRFISSYWEDSDIGGKRHYYKITENGLAQLDTYPPLSELVGIALSDNEEADIDSREKVSETFIKSSSPSPFDNFALNSSNEDATNDQSNPFDNFSTDLNTSSENDLNKQINKQNSASYNAFEAYKSFSNLNETADFIENQNDDDLDDLSPISEENKEDFAPSFVGENIKIQAQNEQNSGQENDFRLNNQNYDEYENVAENNYTTALTENEKLDSLATSPTAENNLIDNNIIVNTQNLSIDSDKNYLASNLTVEHYDSVENVALESIKKEAENSSSTKTYDIFDVLSFNDQKDEKNNKNSDIGTKNIDNFNNDDDKLINENKDSNLNNSPTTLELNNPFFKDDNKKTLTEKSNLEINSENIKLLSKEDNSNEFAEEKSVATFAQKKKIEPANNDVYKSSLNEIFTTKNINVEPQQTTRCDIVYNDYVDYKNDKNVKSAKRFSKLRLLKTITSSFISLCIILATFCAVLKQNVTAIYGVFSSILTLLVVFYTCNFIGKYKLDYIHFINNEQKFNFKKQIVIRGVIFLVLTIALIVINLSMSVKNIFAISNFGNFLATICMMSILFTDYFCAWIFYKVIK